MGENTVDIKDIIEIYEIANSLLISLETTSPQGEVVLMYQIRYAFDHVIDAFKLAQKSNADSDAIKGELKRARGHLVRVIYDAAEIIVLWSLKTLHDGVRFVSPKVIKEIYSEFYSDYEKLYKFREELNKYKIEKSNDTDITVLKDLAKMANEAIKITTDFELKKKLMRNANVRYFVWSGLGVILSATITFLVTYFASR